MWGDIAIAFVLAFITSYMCTPRTIQIAKKLGAVDSPKDKRRINKVVMPRLGGLAVITGFFVAIIFLLVVMSIEKNIDLNQGEWYKKIGGFIAGSAIIISVCFYDITIAYLVNFLASRHNLSYSSKVNSFNGLSHNSSSLLNLFVNF